MADSDSDGHSSCSDIFCTHVVPKKVNKRTPAAPELPEAPVAKDSSTDDIFNHHVGLENVIKFIPAATKSSEVPDTTNDEKGHQMSIAHQMNTPIIHNRPLPAMDRSSKGFKYLIAKGWDPDSGKGLGAAGQGMLHPLDPVEKQNNAGLGHQKPSLSMSMPKAVKKPAPMKVTKKTTKAERRAAQRELEKKAQRERADLHKELFGDDD